MRIFLACPSIYNASGFKATASSAAASSPTTSLGGALATSVSPAQQQQQQQQQGGVAVTSSSSLASNVTAAGSSSPTATPAPMPPPPPPFYHHAPNATERLLSFEAAMAVACGGAAGGNYGNSFVSAISGGSGGAGAAAAGGAGANGLYSLGGGSSNSLASSGIIGSQSSNGAVSPSGGGAPSGASVLSAAAAAAHLRDTRAAMIRRNEDRLLQYTDTLLAMRTLRGAEDGDGTTNTGNNGAEGDSDDEYGGGSGGANADGSSVPLAVVGGPETTEEQQQLRARLRRFHRQRLPLPAHLCSLGLGASHRQSFYAVLLRLGASFNRVEEDDDVGRGGGGKGALPAVPLSERLCFRRGTLPALSASASAPVAVVIGGGSPVRNGSANNNNGSAATFPSSSSVNGGSGADVPYAYAASAPAAVGFNKPLPQRVIDELVPSIEACDASGTPSSGVRKMVLQCAATTVGDDDRYFVFLDEAKITLCSMLEDVELLPPLMGGGGGGIGPAAASADYLHHPTHLIPPQTMAAAAAAAAASSGGSSPRPSTAASGVAASPPPLLRRLYGLPTASAKVLAEREAAAAAAASAAAAEGTAAAAGSNKTAKGSSSSALASASSAAVPEVLTSSICFAIAPIFFITTDMPTAYYLAKGMYQQLWRFTQRPTPQLLHMTCLFEHIVATLAPQCALLLGSPPLSLSPLAVAFRWMAGGFAEFLPTAEALAVWDRLVAYMGVAAAEGRRQERLQQQRRHEGGKSSSSPPPPPLQHNALTLLPFSWLALVAASMLLLRAPLISRCTTKQEATACLWDFGNVKIISVVAKTLKAYVEAAGGAREGDRPQRPYGTDFLIAPPPTVGGFGNHTSPQRGGGSGAGGRAGAGGRGGAGAAGVAAGRMQSRLQARDNGRRYAGDEDEEE